MYHVRFTGTHYEMGYRFGSALEKRGQRLLDGVPFPITGERMDYARACLPVYQKFFPEVLEEIRGLAEGQGCELDRLQAVLFSMYAIPPACNCSCFAVSREGHVLLGRNSDFLTRLEKQNTNVIYRFAGDSCDFTGNTTAFVEMEDGVNEYGLALGLTSVYPVTVKPRFQAGLLLRFLLEKCKSTEEVIHRIRRLPIGSAQTITAADIRGDIALIECNAEGTTVVRPSPQRPFVCATNRFASREMAAWQVRDVDDWQAELRYDTLERALGTCGGRMDVQGAQDLLGGKQGFLCQYDRATGKDTVWSVVYDLGEKTIYRAEGNPGRMGFRRDGRFAILS